jgi:Holliday junction resolvasome RuvABC DNA-binding subunit
MVAKVFFALRHLGFRDRELSAVLAELRAENHDEAPRASSLLREALSQHGARNARVY